MILISKIYKNNNKNNIITLKIQNYMKNKIRIFQSMNLNQTMNFWIN